MTHFRFYKLWFLRPNICYFFFFTFFLFFFLALHFHFSIYSFWLFHSKFTFFGEIFVPFFIPFTFNFNVGLLSGFASNSICQKPKYWLETQEIYLKPKYLSETKIFVKNQNKNKKIKQTIVVFFFLSWIYHILNVCVEWRLQEHWQTFLWSILFFAWAAFFSQGDDFPSLDKHLTKHSANISSLIKLHFFSQGGDFPSLDKH